MNNSGNRIFLYEENILITNSSIPWQYGECRWVRIFLESLPFSFVTMLTNINIAIHPYGYALYAGPAVYPKADFRQFETKPDFRIAWSFSEYANWYTEVLVNQSYWLFVRKK
jgi:hypothetical protein